jgi:hypothetical protein
MYIKKLSNSSVLERGELLIVLKCLWLYRDNGFIDLRKRHENRSRPILPASPGASSMG